jgi:metal-responsive CopG/Arc/MetJ family transcriptional regulator
MYSKTKCYYTQEDDMSRTTRTLTVSLPPRLYDEVERLAEQGNQTKSELVRDMIRVYEDYLDDRRWKHLRVIGAETAVRYDITSEKDIERLVHEARGIKD